MAICPPLAVHSIISDTLSMHLFHFISVLPTVKSEKFSFLGGKVGFSYGESEKT